MQLMQMVLFLLQLMLRWKDRRNFEMPFLIKILLFLNVTALRAVVKDHS